MTTAIATIIAAIIGLVGTGATVAGTMINNKKNRETQEAINDKNLETAEKENAITREREDNAHQREVADLQQSGLSPLAAMAGANASSGTVIPAQAYQAEAPSFDMSAIMDAVMRNAELTENKRQFNETLGENEKNRQLEKDKIDEAREEFKLELEEKKHQFDTNTKIQIEKYEADTTAVYDQLEFAVEKDNNETKKILAEESDNWIQTIQEQFGYMGINEVDSESEYRTRFEHSTTLINMFWDWLADKEGNLESPTSTSTAEGQGIGTNAPLGAGSVSYSDNASQSATVSGDVNKQRDLAKLWGEFKSYYLTGDGKSTLKRLKYDSDDFLLPKYVPSYGSSSKRSKPTYSEYKRAS